MTPVCKKKNYVAFFTKVASWAKDEAKFEFSRVLLVERNGTADDILNKIL